jgi:hypothetical protein
MHEVILSILRNSLNMQINDVTDEGDHIIVTIDTGDEYRTVRVDVTDLGPDYLEHE